MGEEAALQCQYLNFENEFATMEAVRMKVRIINSQVKYRENAF